MEGRKVGEAEVIRETTKAVLFNLEGEEVWVPKSCIHDDSEVWDLSDEGRGPGELVVAEWFADKEGW